MFARHHPFRRLAAAGAAAILAVSLAACGSGASGSDGDSSTPNPGSSGSAVDQTTAASTGGGSGPATAASSGSPSPSQDGAADKAPLTIYTGQHEALVQALTDAFTADTGITVNLRAGDDAELANQLIEEGDATPADLFLSEEPSPMGLLDGKGLLAAVDTSTLDEVDPALVPSSGNWMPYAARSRVIYYNPNLITVDELPHSIMDLTDPQWKGKFGYAPSGAFAATVSYLINTIGEDKTLSWLEGIKANGVNEQTNGKIRDAVEAGQIPFGLSNHYYWWILANSKGGPDKLTSKIYYFDHPDAGSLVMASGAGILKASKHQSEAQQFLAWLGSADGGQQVIAGNQAAQYPVAPGVTSKAGLQPLSELHAPDVDQSVFADTAAAKDLIIKAGIA
ncbi:MAG TPA: extracellular solute-binding protein [Nakamurella sp.]|nr:extracellular solute-binding protein [Nakamurella sp.]